MNDLERFIIHYIQNSPQIMWFLGAGASRSAGIPTAWDIVWELKCRTYCILQERTFSSYSDYTSPAIREEVQSFLNGREEFKDIRPDDEYSFFLEYVYKANPSGLREFVQEKIKNEDVHPSYGHKFLAILLKQELCNIIWTTNFDSLIEDAHSDIGGKPSDLNIAELSGSTLAKQAINDRAFPLYVKLHGDFRYETIRNLKEDLLENDEFSEALEISCNQYGLAVSGYSGRDESVMKYLSNALDKDNPFPKGLFWFVRPNQEPLQAVKNLIKKAREKNVNAQLIEIDSFNELMSKIKKQFLSLPTELVREHLDRRYSSPKADIPATSNKFPKIKTNALPITRMPQKCYALKNSGVKDFRELKEKLAKVGEYFPVSYRKGDILAMDKKVGQILGGNLETFLLTEELLNDKNETHIYGFLQKNIFNSAVKDKPLKIFSRGSTAHIVVDHRNKNSSVFLPLSKAAETAHRSKYLCGTIKNTQMHWAESVKLKLDRTHSGFWILLTPDIWIDKGNQERDGYSKEWEEAKSFKDNRLKWRRNYEKAMFIDAWQKILFGKIGKSETVEIGIVNDGNLKENALLINSLSSSGRL